MLDSRMLVAAPLAVLAWSSPPVAAQADGSAEREHKQPVELGRVRWLRDEQQARKLAARTGRPLLVLFQEVPG